MGFASDLADIRDWWLAELAGLIGVRSRGRGTQVDIVAEIGRGVVRVSRPDRTPLFEAKLSEFADELGRHVQLGTLRQSPSIGLVLEAGRALERPLAPLRLPRRRALDMALLDVQSSTPLDPAEALILLAQESGAVRAQRYFVVKRGNLEPVLRAAYQHGRVVFVRALTADGPITLQHADYRGLTPPGWRGKIASILTKAAVAACLIALPATAAHAYWRYSSAIASLDSEVEGLDGEVKVVRALSKQRTDRIARLQAVRMEKAQAVPLVSVWEEMTKIIPDNTWLSDLAVDGDKVTFTGLSKSASDLIALLEASPLFSNPTFAAPVVRAPDADGERFTIEMRIDRS